MQAGATQGAVEENRSALAGGTKRGAKSSNSKTSDSLGRGNSSGQTSASVSAAPEKAAAAVVIPSTAAPVLNWKIGIHGFALDTLASGAVPNDGGASSSTSGLDSSSPTRAAKSSDSSASDSPDRVSDLIQAPPPVPDVQGNASPVAAAPSTPAPVFNWNIGIQDSTPDALATGAADLKSSSTSSLDPAATPDVIGGSTALPGLSKDAAPKEAAPKESAPKDVRQTEQQGETGVQDSANLAAADNRDAGAVASLIASLSGTPASNSKTQPGGETLPLRNVARGRSETSDNDNQAQTAVKSGTGVLDVPLSNLPSALVSPNSPTGSVASGNSQPIPSKPVLGQSKTSGVQEVVGTIRNSGEVTGSVKAQPHKDESSLSADSQAAGQGTTSAPAKATDVLSSFSLVGDPSSSAAGDGKSLNASLSPRASDPQASRLETESTGVAQSQTQPQTAAGYPASVVNSAKLVERIGETEIRLGIRAGEFGNVDIRTLMVRNQLSAEISAERGEMGRALAAELPSLQNRLSEQRVPMSDITVQNHTGGQSAASEQQKPRDGQQVYTTSAVGERNDLTPALVAMEGTTPTSRLDIHM